MLLEQFELSPFGYRLTPCVDTLEFSNFHNAYLRANTLAFEADLNMPRWVYVDYLLYRMAAVGFMIEVGRVPSSVLAQFDSDPRIVLDDLEYLPISGQTAGRAVDNGTWQGVSLFSLSRMFPALRDCKLATLTRALALRAFGAERFRGITQYDNPAVVVYGKTTRRLEILQPMVWLHPRTHMTFVYESLIDYSLEDLNRGEPEEYSFLLNAHDIEQKRYIEHRIGQGHRYSIVSPYRISEGDAVFIPIREE